jgi:hypothetical protein
VPGATGHRYSAHDSDGRGMDTLKIIDGPAGGYLGVYHQGTEVWLGASDDLLSWTAASMLDHQATQPTILQLPTGAVVTAVKANRGDGGLLRLRHYPGMDDLVDGRFDRERTLPRRLSRCNEGTPSLESVTLAPDIDHSVIEIGFHYHRGCRLDRQARGTLTDLDDWAAARDEDLDAGVEVAAAQLGMRVKGNIGDRDSVVHEGVRYTLLEVQYRRGDFGSWRVYLIDASTGAIAYQPITTHGGSAAFANPTVARVVSPSGGRALVFTMFLPHEGARPGEAGELVYYRENTD